MLPSTEQITRWQDGAHGGAARIDRACVLEPVEIGRAWHDQMLVARRHGLATPMPIFIAISGLFWPAGDVGDLTEDFTAREHGTYPRIRVEQHVRRKWHAALIKLQTDSIFPAEAGNHLGVKNGPNWSCRSKGQVSLKVIPADQVIAIEDADKGASGLLDTQVARQRRISC